MNAHRALETMVDAQHLTDKQAESVRDWLDEPRDASLSDLLDGLLDEDIYSDRPEAATHLARSFGMEYVDLESIDVDTGLVERIDASTAQQYFVFPIQATERGIQVAVDEPPDVRATDDLEVLFDRPLEFCLADSALLEKMIVEYYGTSIDDINAVLQEAGEADLVYVEPDEETEDTGQLEEQAEEAPVIKLVNTIIMDAVKRGASDIHLEPLERRFLIRYRIDGVLQEVHEPPKRLEGPVISRIKIMANMDIAERRVPQDGRIKMKVRGREIDFRVNTLPAQHGESVVLRVLDKEAVSFGLEELGFLSDNREVFDDLIRRPHGMILVTGSTGSGKTTTLYSALFELNTSQRKLVTVEDPVEYQIEGINQMQVNDEIGLDFALGLRTLLRQSPDVILVGEIRDRETAEIAIRSALTGHLVFSTLHTNDAPGAVDRLIDLGVSRYLVASAIQAVVAQRLVRTICENCKEPYEPEEEYLRQVGFPLDDVSDTTFYRGEGCDECDQTGYSGRTAVFEMLVNTDSISETILNEGSTQDIRDHALLEGMRTLRQDGFLKVKLGQTTLMEVARVTQAHEAVAKV